MRAVHFSYCGGFAMLWPKRGLWKAGIALAGLMLLLVLMVWVPFSAAGTYERASGFAGPGTVTLQTPSAADLTVTAVVQDQLRQQDEMLQRENSFPWVILNAVGSSIGTILVAAAALIAAWLGWRQWFTNRKDEQTKRREDQLSQQEKLAEERFQKVVEGLGSERMEARVGAAIMLRTFLQPGYERFYSQAFDLAVAHLRLRKAQASALELSSSPVPVLIVPKGDLQQKQQLPPSTAPVPLDSLSQALITVFKEASPLARNELKKNNAQFDPQLLDATNVRLDNAYLCDADLVEAWLLLASLRGANLGGAQLKGANLIGAHLEGANLKEAQLEGANLSYAHCKGADLKGAQLKGANLIYAQLTGANLSGANLMHAALQRANLSGADLSNVNLMFADLSDTNIEKAQSLEKTNLYNAKGLTDDQLRACKDAHAIIDEDAIPGSSESATSTSQQPQSNDTQHPSIPPAQVNTSPPSTDESNASTTQQSNNAQVPSTSSVQESTSPPDSDGSSTPSSQPSAEEP
jgi:uncharacterized protein YjbI with pentapeptide repeats